MKFTFKTFLILLPLLLLMATCTPVAAQGWTTLNADVIYSDGNAGKSIRMQGVIDSTITTYYSNSFQLSGYQGESFYSYPLHYRYRNISAAGTPYVTTYIQGNYGDSTWITIDTLCVRDSTEANQNGTADLNGKKCYAYRTQSFGGTTAANAKNRSDTISEITFYINRRDFKP